MKDETNMRPITEWLALKPKMYSFIADAEKETEELVDMEFVKSFEVKEDAHHKKCKGITKNTQLSHADYMAVHEQDTEILRMQRGFRSFKHRVYTVMNQKIALSSFDDKAVENGQEPWCSIRPFSLGMKQGK